MATKKKTSESAEKSVAVNSTQGKTKIGVTTSMKITDLDVAGYIEFEGSEYKYWEMEIDGLMMKIAELELEKALYPEYPKMKVKNHVAESIDEQICYYATDDEMIEDIKAAIVGE